MPKGENEAFRNQIGDHGQLPEIPRGDAGRFDTPRAKAGREAALDILNDPEYRANLKKRMVAGEGGPIEVWIWRIGFGDPQKDDSDREADRARFAAIRLAAKEFLQRHPDQAHLIDAQIQGATRLLPRPTLVLPPKTEPEDGGEPA